jgi:hypothetical protein
MVVLKGEYITDVGGNAGIAAGAAWSGNVTVSSRVIMSIVVSVATGSTMIFNAYDFVRKCINARRSSLELTCR